MKGLISRSGLKKLSVRFCHAPNIILRDTIHCARKQLCSNTLKRNELKVFISLKKINWHVWRIAKTHFRYPHFSSSFLKKVSRDARLFTVVLASAKLQKSQQGLQKNCVPEFPMLSAHKLPSCGLVVFIDMNTYIVTEGRSFKAFLKENYAVVWESCYLFTKKMLNMELNMIFIDSAGVCVYTLDIPEIYSRFDEYLAV